MPKMLRSGETRRKPPGQVRPAIIRVHNCDVSGLQISHEGRTESGDGRDTSALVPAPVLHVIVYWGSLELDTFPFENFSDRPIRMMQHDQGRESRSVKVGYQAKRGQMTSADIVAYERKAHSDSFVGVAHLIDFYLFLRAGPDRQPSGGPLA